MPLLQSAFQSAYKHTSQRQEILFKSLQATRLQVDTFVTDEIMKPCERCAKEPAARYVFSPRELHLCWSCFDAWRRWYLGAAYRFALPIETLKAVHAARVEA